MAAKEITLCYRDKRRIGASSDRPCWVFRSGIGFELTAAKSDAASPGQRTGRQGECAQHELGQLAEAQRRLQPASRRLDCRDGVRRNHILGAGPVELHGFRDASLHDLYPNTSCLAAAVELLARLYCSASGSQSGFPRGWAARSINKQLE